MTNYTILGSQFRFAKENDFAQKNCTNEQKHGFMSLFITF